MPVTPTTKCFSIQYTDPNKTTRYQRELIHTPIRLEDGRLLFDADYSGDRSIARAAYMFDPTPDAPWPHPVCYTVGHYQTTRVCLAKQKPDGQYMLAPVPIDKICKSLDREPTVHKLLADRLPHSLRVDSYALAHTVGVSQSVLKKWIETGVVTEATREKLRAVLGDLPDDEIM